MDTTLLVRTERDALACLGLLANGFARFDVPVEYPGETAPSHVTGLNIHGAMVDNPDGELLALERNSIHSEGSPLQHGEQRALRAAITRVAAKRPRGPSQAIEHYYRTTMFMTKGAEPSDYVNLGATLYTTLEPCPMCASASLVCRVKRLVFVIPDMKYGGAWRTLKTRYYDGDDAAYDQLDLGVVQTTVTARVEDLRCRLIAKATSLRSSGVRDTHILDHCRDYLQEAFDMLAALKPADLESLQAGDPRNEVTLRGFQHSLNMPHK